MIWPGFCVYSGAWRVVQGTFSADTMDQGTGDSRQGQSTPATETFLIKLELPWSMNEEPQDQPSAVYSTVQPLSDNTFGSLLKLNTSHACQHCSAVFMLSSSLKVHLETFHGKTLHSELPVASRLHDSASESTEMKPEPPWSVKEEPQDQPSAVYSTVQPLSDNTESLPSLNTSHVCQHCSASFALLSSLELHMATFHGETLHNLFSSYSAYKCCGVSYHCGTKIVNAGNYKKKKGVKGRKLEDSDTGRTNQEKKHVCDVCSKRFSRTGSLREHKLIHTGHKPFVCDVCSKAFSLSRMLKRHKMIHTGQKSFVCDVCCKAFTYSSNLRDHKLIHGDHKSFVCDVCNKTFSRADSLKSHKLIHSGQKLFVCDVCHKAFTFATNLKEHKLIHTGHKSFVCDVCNKAFTQACNLKEHKLIHTDHKPFVCDVCSKAFSLSRMLKRHKMIHTGQKSFVCDVCCKAFTYSSNLRDHKLIHGDHKSFVCDVCSKAFSVSRALKRHKMIHTSKKS